VSKYTKLAVMFRWPDICRTFSIVASAVLNYLAMQLEFVCMVWPPTCNT